MQIIGLVGLIGSGKGTVADFLINDHRFKKISFADALKDGVAVMFGWDREMLEGDTDESREWREQKDEFWSDRLERDFTPRLALQLMGTEAGRDVFGQDLWVAGVEKKIIYAEEHPWDHIIDGEGPQEIRIVLPDTRFANEIEMIKRLGGIMVRVERGERPEWWDLAREINGDLAKDPGAYTGELDEIIHPSESRWIGIDEPDHVIFNNFDLDRLKWAAEQLATLP